MKALFFLLFLILAGECLAQGKQTFKEEPHINLAPADTIIVFPPASEKRYNDIAKQIRNLQDPDWVAEQVEALRAMQRVILTTILETEKRADVQIKDLRPGQLIVKPGSITKK